MRPGGIRLGFFCVTFVLILVAASDAFAITFTTAGPFPSGQQTDFRTSGVAVADIDKDGHVDLAVTNFGPSAQPPYGNTSVLWGDGAGGFGAPQDWDDGIKGGLVAIDLDGDGSTDLVTWSGSGVQVYWGNGTRAPAGQQMILTTFTADVVVADIDGDGDLDVVATDQSTDQLTVVYNDGGRLFHSASFAAAGGPTGLAVGQLDSQYGADFAITGFWTSLVSVVLNSGPGSYQPPTSLPGGALPSGIVIGEFTGDGIPDLFYARRGCFVDAETSCANEGVTVLAGDGTGGFSEWTTASAGDGPSAVAIGDLNGDGRDDVAVANFNSNDVSVFLGQPSGGLTALPPLAVDRGPIGIVMADMNGDGCPDIITANWRSATVSVLLTSGCTPPPTLTPTPTPTPTPLCVATPRAGCRSSGKGSVLLRQGADSSKNKLIWKWTQGAATTQAEFGNPTTTADYALCIYAGTVSSLIGQAVIPASASKWRSAGAGYSYRDAAGTADGITTVKLRGSALNQSKALVTGKGAALPHLPLPVTASVTIELVNGDSGLCWGTAYDGSRLLRNDGAQLKARFP